MYTVKQFHRDEHGNEMGTRWTKVPPSKSKVRWQNIETFNTASTGH